MEKHGHLRLDKEIRGSLTIRIPTRAILFRNSIHDLILLWHPGQISQIAKHRTGTRRQQSGQSFLLQEEDEQ